MTKRVIGIAAEALEFITEAAANAHPQETIGYLTAEPASDYGLSADGRIITSVMFIPGTKTTNSSATVKDWMAPTDTSTVGSVHSHPSGATRPSNADLATFNSGRVHIILGAPYTMQSWEAYDPNGQPRDLDVYDVDLGDPEDFFDFTEEDILAEINAKKDRGDRSSSLLARFWPW